MVMADNGIGCHMRLPVLWQAFYVHFLTYPTKSQEVQISISVLQISLLRLVEVMWLVHVT